MRKTTNKPLKGRLPPFYIFLFEEKKRMKTLKVHSGYFQARPLIAQSHGLKRFDRLSCETSPQYGRRTSYQVFLLVARV